MYLVLILVQENLHTALKATFLGVGSFGEKYCPSFKNGNESLAWEDEGFTNRHANFVGPNLKRLCNYSDVWEFVITGILR